MAQWDDGYVTDVAYTYKFYREITPGWLALTALLLGQRPPDISAPFCYADLGCGNGFTTLVVAASFPQAEVWGFDFNPAHVEFATMLAARAGLSNAHFVETSFADLAAHPFAALPDFDLMVAHGVLSWISPANRHHLVTAIARHLKPGGLVYLGYNVITGWTAMVPVRQLMRMLAVASRDRTDRAVPGVLDFVDRLKEAGALYFRANAAAEAQLADIRKQDARYIAHEYLNRDWHPLMFAEVAGEMADAKCRYIGSATLAENLDMVSVPRNVGAMLAEVRDPLLRETLRDIGCAQTFRRDLYRKGVAPLPAAEQQALVEALTLAPLGQAVPAEGVTFATPIGNVTGLPEIYDPLLAMLRNGEISLGRVRQSAAFAGRSMVELLQAFTLLAAAGYAHPLLPSGGTEAGRMACRRLNQVIAEAARMSGELVRLAAPAIGSAVGTDVLEVLVVGALLAGRPAAVEALSDEVLSVLVRSGRAVQREGQAVTEPAEARRVVADAIGGVVAQRVPVLERLGVL